MRVECKFDDKDQVIKYNNILIIENGCVYDEVMVRICDSDGHEIVSTQVDGNKLIKAIQNAMNV